MNGIGSQAALHTTPTKMSALKSRNIGVNGHQDLQ
jgi:hypothetical protein